MIDSCGPLKVCNRQIIYSCIKVKSGLINSSYTAYFNLMNQRDMKINRVRFKDAMSKWPYKKSV